MYAILVNNGCAIAIEGKANKAKDMTNAQLDKKDKMAITNILLVLDDSVLFNVSDQTTVEGLLEKIKNINEAKSMSNKIFLGR